MACKYGTWNRGQDEALLNILGGQEVAEQIIARRVRVTIEEIEKVGESILEFVSTVSISPTTGPFVAKERFVVNTKRNAPVKINYLSDDFISRFLLGEGKTEDPIGEQTLRSHKLRQSSVDGPIITELGGEAKAETTLTEVFSPMEKQKNGEDGVLLNNGYANIFYIRDQNGLLCAVGARWVGVGWYVFACSVEAPGRWFGGCRVFSRDSALSPLEPLIPAQG